MKKEIVVGLGEILWDVLPQGKKVGGAPGNFAYHASQFGFHGTVISAVGNDALGTELLGNIESKGIGENIQRVDHPTGTVGISLDPAGIPHYEIHTDVAWDNIAYTPQLEALAGSCSVVVFGSLAQRCEVSRTTIQRFLDTMPSENGRYKVFDINLRGDFYTQQTIEQSIRRCNVLKINDEELVVVSAMFLGAKTADNSRQMSQQEQCTALLGHFGLEILILTCGTLGSYVFSGGEVSFVATPKVEVADTVGAGDSFTATFISALRRGMPIPCAHQRAVEVSAYVCTQHGAMPQLPESLLF